jgi:hypothetical protein
MAAIRVNPRALEAATRKALEAGGLQRRWDDLTEEERRGCLIQADILIRAYADAKEADLADRRGKT